MVISASWHRWSGTNDRFALVTRGAAETYGLRYGQIDTFLREGVGPLHAELFLQWCLDQQPAIGQLPSISIRAHRVRCKESTQLLAPLDLSLPGLVAAQKALLGSVREWLGEEALAKRRALRGWMGRVRRYWGQPWSSWRPRADGFGDQNRSR